MKLKKKRLNRLNDRLQAIREQTLAYEEKYREELEAVHPLYLKSAKNLIHYLALRNEDISDLQDTLWQLGISRLGRAERHVLASISSVQKIIEVILGKLPGSTEKPEISFKRGRKLLKANTTALFGKKLKGSKVRIMVTLPSDASGDYKFVKKLFKSGMNTARINCAHDGPAVWDGMIKNIEKAKKATGRACKVSMDLGGPKLRTGAMREGPKVIHLSPEKDLLGNIISPAEAWVVPEGQTRDKLDGAVIPVSSDFFNELNPDDEIYITDSRGKNKKLIVDKKAAGSKLVRCYDSVYIKTGNELILKCKRESDGLKTSAGELPPVEETIILKAGDMLILHKDPSPGEPAEFSTEGDLIKPAHISCTLPEIFNDVKPGEPVILDDGKIEAVISKASNESLELKITYAKEEGSKLRGDKGINLPESDLSIKGLTEKDKQDMEFVARHADIVNYSFVNTPDDVQEMFTKLEELEAKHLGIIFKIETRKAFENLPAILLKGMQHYPVGVMIARGDLAIECGWKELAGIQEEILWVCEAAHIPIVWATQVLETMARKGRPSRAEVTDAALAEQAECVMLNKGPYIFEVIEMLDTIMSSMQKYHDKKSPMLPPLKVKASKEKLKEVKTEEVPV